MALRNCLPQRAVLSSCPSLGFQLCRDSVGLLDLNQSKAHWHWMEAQSPKMEPLIVARIFHAALTVELRIVRLLEVLEEEQVGQTRSLKKAAVLPPYGVVKSCELCARRLAT